jgi:iron(III) transport system substrate-binding protein
MNRLFLLTVALVFGIAAQARAQDTQSWDQLVAAAQKEGKVVVIGPPDPEVRKDLPVAFKNKFGITVDYLGGRTNEQVAKLRAERSAGLYTADIVLAGLGTTATTFYPEKMLAPIKPALILPEVIDGSKWKKGSLWFADPEQRYILRLSNTVQPSFYINTDGVKPGDFHSGRDLLDPKWKGKIAAQDPTTLGSGATTAARIYAAFGEADLRTFYTDRKPAISRDARELTDWLLHGTYPIVLNADEDQVEQMKAEGMPVTAMYGLPGLSATTSAEFGMLAMFGPAPHPNAAKVFANWIASKEGMEVWDRARNEVPARNDIDEKSFLTPSKIPEPGIEYFDTYSWEFTINTRDKVRGMMKEILGR